MCVGCPCLQSAKSDSNREKEPEIEIERERLRERERGKGSETECAKSDLLKQRVKYRAPEKVDIS